MLNERNTLLEEDGIEEEILVEEECSVAQAVWGDIQGNIENQTDLQNALDAKQDSLTEAQLNAVNSGITSEKVTTYDGYADQIARKADQSALNAESITRGEADTALGTRIDNEALARQQADNGLQTQIDAITSKSDVVDVVANYAALQAYDTSTLGNNDVIKVLDDETHEDALTYYRWSTATQTWSYIGQEAPYYSKGQMDVKLAEKQDKLTAGANIQIQNGTISATDTTYAAGNGLNLNGTEFSADTTVLATKEDLEGYYTKPETDNLLAPKLEAEVVAELPTTGAEGKLYLTPKAHTTSTATGNPIEATITAQAGQLESFQLDGDTFQQSYTGKNLYNVATLQTGASVTKDDDGWITITKDNSSGSSASYTNAWTDNLDLETSTQYAIFLEIKAVSGTGELDITSTNSTQGQFSSWESKQIASLTTGTYKITATTKSSFSGIYGGLRTILNLSAGQSASITFRLSVLADTSVGVSSFVYEPYVGGQPSPNPDYPQQIQTVTGEQTVTVTGKNKINMPYGETVWNGASVLQNGTTLTMKPNSTGGMGLSYSTPAIPVVIPAGETITWSRTWLGGGTWDSGSFTFPLEITYSDETTETISLGDTTKNNYLVAASSSVALAKDVVSVRILNALCYGIKEMTGDIVFGVQLEYGSSASDYAPYSKQTYDINLGKNLLNPNSSEWQQGYWTYGGGSLIASSGRVCQINKTPVYEETTFTFTTDMNIAFRVDFWNLDGSASGQFVGWFDPTATNITKTFTVPANMCYTITLGWKGGGVLTPSDVASHALMLELGSTATTYAPYFTPIELCKLGTYQDYIYKDGDSWKVHKATETKVLNGSDSEDWTALTYGGYTYELQTALPTPNSPSKLLVLSGYFFGIPYDNRTQNIPNSIYLSDTGRKINIRNTAWTTVEQFKTWLASNNTTVYYALETPTDTTITDTDLIAQFEAIRTALLENGTNTITNTATEPNLAGDMEIGYYGFNPRNRYDKWLWLDLNNNYEQIGGE